MKELKSKIQTCLKDFTDLFTDNELNETKLISLVCPDGKSSNQELTDKIIDKFFEDEDIKRQFFSIKEKYCLFQAQDFKFFLESHKTYNSYTQFKNQIGLSESNRYLKHSGDVVLNFPFKDCILEGGQSNEDGKDYNIEFDKSGELKELHEKRREIFFNEIVAKDDIDRLKNPKAFTNARIIHKNTKLEDASDPSKGRTENSINSISVNSNENANEHTNTTKSINTNTNNSDNINNYSKSSKKCSYASIEINHNTDNMLIKGNNLLALYSLLPIYQGKVKLIYIDPPYNTGNDGFKYNDNFNHSTWLTFMKNRLEVAKELLRDDGVIFVNIDDNEQAYLKVLMDEVFERRNFIGDIIRKTKSTTNDKQTGFNNQHDIVLVFAKKIANIKLNGKQKSWDNYKNPDNDPNGDWISDNPSAPTGSYFEIVNPYTGKVDLPPQNCCWRFCGATFKKYVESGKIKFKQAHKPNERSFIFKRYQNEVKSEFHLLNSLDGCDNRYMNQVATKEMNRSMGEHSFSYPKPEEFIEFIISSATKPNDLVLDFFAGSGTTGAVAHKMGRRWIMIEQMDYVETITKVRMQKTLEGERGGVSKNHNWTGGGSFVYFELAKWNEEAKERILSCNGIEDYVETINGTEVKKEGLKSIFKDMYEKYFLNYNLNAKLFLEGKNSQAIVDKNEFKALPLRKQKEIFCNMLDLNQMYVLASEAEDPIYKLTKNDIEFTKSFYNPVYENAYNNQNALTSLDLYSKAKTNEEEKEENAEANKKQEWKVHEASKTESEDQIKEEEETFEYVDYEYEA